MKIDLPAQGISSHRVYAGIEPRQRWNYTRFVANLTLNPRANSRTKGSRDAR
jgi:hypothetical protein